MLFFDIAGDFQRSQLSWCYLWPRKHSLYVC